MNMNVNIKIVRPSGKIPTYGSGLSAGADLYACIDKKVAIWPRDTEAIPTGIAIEIPEGYAGLIYARSGLSCKKDLAPANKVGVIDSDYRGEVVVMLHNHGREIRFIEPGDRIAELIITPVVQASYQEVEELGETVRSSGGFGSTGK